MFRLLDLDSLPLNKVGTAGYNDLVRRCRGQLASGDMFSLDHLIRPETLELSLTEILPHLGNALPIRREQTVYGTTAPEGLPADHPAARRLLSLHRVIPADRLPKGAVVQRIYEYDPLQRFIAETLGLRRIYPLEDLNARVHIMAFHAGEGLNWRFDPSPFTITLVLQAARAGGIFEYCRGLRTETDPNITGVGALLAGESVETQATVLPAGTVTVFRGHLMAHRMTPVQGNAPSVMVQFIYGDQAA